MPVRLFLAVIVVAIVWGFMAHYRKQKPSVKKQLAVRYAIYGGVGLVVVLAMTGHLHWLSAAITALVAGVVRFLPMAARLFPMFAHLYQQKKSTGTSSGNNSTVQSDYLKVVLDHDSESMHGEVIAGPQAGKTLDQLSKAQLKELLIHYQQNDNDSFQLLFAYVQRNFPDEQWAEEQWSDETGNRQQQDSQNNLTTMNRKEALEILGLEENASKQEITTAHKKLMQRLHPDRGGSTYLAAKVNQAKDFLLD